MLTKNDITKDDSRLAVGLAKCYFCGGPNEVIINRLLTRVSADRIREADGKVISMDPCSKCADMMKQGVILITISSELSDRDWNMQSMPNPYRTGGFFVVRDEAIRRIVQPKDIADWAIEHRWMFIEHEAAEKLGLFRIAEAS